MYVCICNAIREKDLRGAARGCPRSDAEALYGKLGFKPQCGQCLEDADEIVADERACQLA
jgi:bacterioferritin-associated ferredoxin